MAKKKTNSKAASFESSLEALKAIVSDLENGSLSLDESLEKYELGVKHLNNCYKSLKSAQRKIEVLVELDDEGKLKTVPFEDQATEFDSQDSQDSQDSDESDEDDDMDDSNALF